MNILLIHSHAIMPNSQGVSKVLLTLRSLFREKGHVVIALAMHRYETDTIDDQSQFFLPTKEINCQDNLTFFCSLIHDYRIERTINTCVQFDELRLISRCCTICEIPVVTGLHNMILTPVYNYYATREYSLKKRHLGLIYYFLRTTPLKWILSRIYIMRYRNFYKNVYESSDAVVLLNETMKREFLQMIGLRETKKAFVIPNTLNDIPNVINNKENIVLWVGKMDTSIKRPDLMLRIWEKVESYYPDWRLMMLGKGDGQAEVVWNEMKSLSMNLKLKNVYFEGQVNVQPYYDKAKILCVTSTHEAFPMVLVEALFNGLVPVAFNSFPAASTLIHENVNGLLIKPFDIKDYARCLSELMREKQKLTFLQSNRMSTANKFCKEEVYHQWNKLFSEVAIN